MVVSCSSTSYFNEALSFSVSSRIRVCLPDSPACPASLLRTGTCEDITNMSFLDTSPDLASDLHDVFNMLYPPSPDSTVSDDWRDGDDNVTSTGALANTSTEVVDLDEPVNGLAPLDVHEQRSLTAHEGHPTQGERHSRIELLLDKLSRVSRSVFKQMAL